MALSREKPLLCFTKAIKLIQCDGSRNCARRPREFFPGNRSPDGSRPGSPPYSLEMNNLDREFRQWETIYSAVRPDQSLGDLRPRTSSCRGLHLKKRKGTKNVTTWTSKK